MSSKKKAVRAAFREAVFSRDNHKCVVCGATGVPLDAHHIHPREDMPNGGYVASNGVTLCDTEDGCHAKAEAVLQGRAEDPVYAPSALYNKIGSGLERATADAARLRQ